MKKNIMYVSLGVVLILLIVAFIGTHKFITNENLKPKFFNNMSFNGTSSQGLYCELDDRYVYTYDLIDKIRYTYEDVTKELGTWLKEDKDFINIMIKDLESLNNPVKTYERDGGSKEYHDGNIGIIVCNTIDGNKNIYIGKELTDNVHCVNYRKQIVLEKEENDKVINIIDKEKYTKGMTAWCTEDIKPFYELGEYKYSFRCEQIVVVLYESGFIEDVASAISSGSITLNDLDKFNIKYKKERK